MQAWIDESGGVGQSQHFVLAGLIGEAEEWARFSEEWKAECEKEPRIAPFKMREAANFLGPFAGWNRDDRDERVASLAVILGGYPFTTFHAIVEIEPFSKTIVGKMRQRWAKPYVYAFQFAVAGIAQELWSRGERQRFEIIFDEHVILASRAVAMYEHIRAMYADDEEEGTILPVQPIFRGDADFMPLQAADMFAWLWRMDVDQQPHSFGWLARMLNKMHLSEHSDFVDEERMRLQVQMSMDATFAEEAVKKIQAAIDRGEASE